MSGHTRDYVRVCVYMYETVCVLSVGMWVLLVPRDSLCLAGCGTHRGRSVRSPSSAAEPAGAEGPPGSGAAVSALQGWGGGAHRQQWAGRRRVAPLGPPAGIARMWGILSLGETGQEEQEEG